MNRWAESYQVRRGFAVKALISAATLMTISVLSRRNVPVPGWLALQPLHERYAQTHLRDADDLGYGCAFYVTVASDADTITYLTTQLTASLGWNVKTQSRSSSPGPAVLWLSRSYSGTSPSAARCERTFGPGLAARPGRSLGVMTTEDRIAKLEAEIGQLRAHQTDLRKQLAEAQLDQWRGRVEDLEVQMHLGAMDASDKVTALTERLRDNWADARRQLEQSVTTASSVADTVRSGLEKAFDDLRKALLESKNKLT